MLPMPFSNPSTYPAHSGVDFAQRAGTPYRASGPGVVLRQGWSPITGTKPRAAGEWLTVLYDGGPPVFACHFPRGAFKLGNGRRFEYGDTLAHVGSTGFSTGPHLHLAIDGQPGYAAVWRYFDRSRYVGDGQGSGGGSVTPKPIPTPQPLEDKMQVIKIKDGGGYRYAVTNGYEFQQGELNDAGGLGVMWEAIYGPARDVNGAQWKEAQRIAALFSSVRARSLG